MLNTAIADAA